MKGICGRSTEAADAWRIQSGNGGGCIKKSEGIEERMSFNLSLMQTIGKWRSRSIVTADVILCKQQSYCKQGFELSGFHF